MLNSQLNRLIDILGDQYRPSVLIVCENRWDVFRYFVRNLKLLTSLVDISLWIGKTEGFYLNFADTVVLFTYAQTDDGDDRQSIQLYSIHALLHELFHRQQAFQKESMEEATEEAAADQFATSFVNKRSRLVADIMGWEDEWSMWEE